MTATYFRHGEGRSINARIAESELKMPLTRAIAAVADLAGVTRKTAKKALEKIGPCEWHHVGKFAARCGYYDVEEAVESIADPLFDLRADMAISPTPSRFAWCSSMPPCRDARSVEEKYRAYEAWSTLSGEEKRAAFGEEPWAAKWRERAAFARELAERRMRWVETFSNRQGK